MRATSNCVILMTSLTLSGLKFQFESIIDSFVELGVERVAPCHCSGDEARRLFEERYGEDYIESGVGKRVLLP